VTRPQRGSTGPTNVLVCGVGGQGVILFSNILSQLALDAGLDVKKSEVHGMAQRGGSVTTHIRFGPRVYSPLIEEGTAELVVAFERLEALRYSHFVAGSGRLLYDPHRIEPLPVQIGAVEPMPDDEVDRRLRARAGILVPVAAFAAALELGNAKVQNVVMLGAASNFLEFPEETYTAAIKALVKPAFVDLNLRAFATGKGLVCTTP
jgi:indolepyruvate ferredoxin oxidoreductase beta subunit